MGDRGSFFTEPYRDQSVCLRPGGILAAGEFREALPFLALLLPFCQRLTPLLVLLQPAMPLAETTRLPCLARLAAGETVIFMTPPFSPIETPS